MSPSVPDTTTGFNPTLVRLRRSPFWAGRWSSNAFQSHAGSIEAMIADSYRERQRHRFQSHAGSIEAEQPFAQRGNVFCVSIPRWFD